MSGERVRLRFDGSSLWMRADDAARLYGKKQVEIAKAIRHLKRSKEIDQRIDEIEVVGRLGSIEVMLSHRALFSLGYQLNYGRANAFRDWCGRTLRAL